MEVVDARSQVSKQEGFGPMNANPDIIIHHTAGASLAGATVAQEVAHIQAINSQHINAGFGGFAYHGITFPSGRSYWCATFNRYRAHIQDRNPEFIGWVLAGTFTNVMPGAAQLAGLKVALKFIRSSIATGPGIFGHGQKAVPGAGTSCPGVVANINWEEFLEEDELTDEEKRIIADRNGRVAFAWGSTNEFNLWFDEATRIIHAYDPGSQEEVGSIRLRNLPPKLQPVTADALPPERLGV